MDLLAAFMYNTFPQYVGTFWAWRAVGIILHMLIKSYFGHADWGGVSGMPPPEIRYIELSANPVFLYQTICAARTPTEMPGAHRV